MSLPITLIFKSKKEVSLSEVFALFNWSSAGYISGICFSNSGLSRVKISSNNICIVFLFDVHVIKRLLTVKSYYRVLHDKTYCYIYHAVPVTVLLIAHAGKMWSPLGDRYFSALIAQRLARSLRKRKSPGSSPTVGKNFSFCNFRVTLITGQVSPCKWNQPGHTPN